MEGKGEHLVVQAGEHGVEYESDPEEGTMPLGMRRREASDDEEEGTEVTDRREKPPMRMGSRSGMGDWYNEGAVEQYDDVESEIEEYEEEEELVDEVERGVNDVKGEYDVEVQHVNVADKEVDGEGVDQLEGKKKVIEPYAIPTSGAFYMHDDRFKDNAGRRPPRRTHGGKKLWESKVDEKWGHDKFKEMTLHERNSDNSKKNKGGHYGAGRKYQGENRRYNIGKKSNSYNDNQINAPKSVRGRGPRGYEIYVKSRNEGPSAQYVKKSAETVSNASSRVLPNVESVPLPHRKQSLASRLNSASPPFYPSGSSNKEIPMAQKRDLHAGPSHKNLHHPTAVDASFVAPPRGKTVSNSVRIEKPYIHESITPVSGKPSQRMSHNQMNKPPLTQAAHGMHQIAVNIGVQTSLAASAHNLGQSSSARSQNSSPPGASLPVESFKSVKPDLPPELVNSKVPPAAKGIGIQASGKGSFPYGGAHVIGTSGNMVTHGDHNFAATPAFLPVMPFGGQHPGNMGVPAVGIFPGYVAQQQLGLGTSEMTWLPVLAGAAGPLGASYCSPYVSIDGSYHVRQSGQTSASTTSSTKTNVVDKSNAEQKPSSQRQEIASDEIGQRQKNTRRYTEMSMKFGQ